LQLQEWLNDINPAGNFLFIAHNGSSFDFHLLEKEARRHNVTIPKTWTFGDTKPVITRLINRSPQQEETEEPQQNQNLEEMEIDAQELNKKPKKKHSVKLENLVKKYIPNEVVPHRAKGDIILLWKVLEILFGADHEETRRKLLNIFQVNE